MIDFTKAPSAAAMRAQSFISPTVLAILEEQRRAAVAGFFKILLGSAAVFGAVALGIYVYFGDRMSPADWRFVIMPICVFQAFAAVVAAGQFSAYRKNFKKQVVAPLVTKANAGLKFNAEAGISKEEFLASRLYSGSQKVARFSSEDLIEGSIRGVSMRVSEVHAEAMQMRISSRDDDRTEYKTIFHGVLIVAEAPVAAAKVLIWPIVAGDLAKAGKDFSGFQKVPGIHPSFDQLFSVYAQDAATGEGAARLLGPRLMALAVKSNCGRVRAACDGKRTYISLPLGKDQLEPPLFSSVERVDLASLINQISTFIDLMNVLSPPEGEHKAA